MAPKIDVREVVEVERRSLRIVPQKVVGTRGLISVIAPFITRLATVVVGAIVHGENEMVHVLGGYVLNDGFETVVMILLTCFRNMQGNDNTRRIAHRAKNAHENICLELWSHFMSLGEYSALSASYRVSGERAPRGKSQRKS